jgi:hypothetical protein
MQTQPTHAALETPRPLLVTFEEILGMHAAATGRPGVVAILKELGNSSTNPSRGPWPVRSAHSAPSSR